MTQQETKVWAVEQAVIALHEISPTSGLVIQFAKDLVEYISKSELEEEEDV